MQRLFFIFLFPWLFLEGAIESRGGSYSAYFSPEDGLAKRFISLITEEKKQILLAAYALFDKDILKALLTAKERGVDVQILLDPFSLKSRSSFEKLLAAGVQIHVWQSEEEVKNWVVGAPIMHHKFAVFGGKRLWTGSFNFTAKASNQNCENALFLDDQKVARAYAKEFSKLVREKGRALKYAKK